MNIPTITANRVQYSDDDIDELRKKYKGDDRLRRLTALFFKIDPIGINFETNADEYDLEATLLMPSLDTTTSVDALTCKIRDVFEWAFGRDLSRPGSFRRCAEEIFLLGLVQTHGKTL